ncbi:MAG TPA: GGDEF domain-containing protein [Candidatus Acidoferrales bacterium]|nr:GGDEF domain-containing protein [Candidatus Acidoferrales bacterium]
MPQSVQHEPEFAGQQAIRQSLKRLDRSTLWFWWNTVVAIGLLATTITIALFPRLLQFDDFLASQKSGSVIGAILALMLLLNFFTLFQQRHLKFFRNQLAEQMETAMRQRIRAEKFYGMAILDPLTGLYNRRFGEERLQEEIVRAERNGDSLAVLLLDLDHFKQINDEYGHAAGDLVLKEFSRRLKRAIRACDVPIRVGGDEFMVVLPECPRENVSVILSRIGPFEVSINKQKIPVGCSRGRAQHQVGDSIESLLARADEALYLEKANRPAVPKHELAEVAASSNPQEKAQDTAYARPPRTSTATN